MEKMQDELIPTRASLIKRLKDWEDQPSWQEFFDIYWKLIYGVARKAGLTDDEAQEVVQETLVSVAKHMPGFNYDPKIGSFKAWLLTMTRWRIIGQFRKRKPGLQEEPAADEDSGRTKRIEKIADPAGDALDGIWEQEWQANLLEAATTLVKRTMDPQKYQIFDLLVNKGSTPERVASQFGVSVNLVYVTKHRVTEALKLEVLRLEKEMT
jgi:RNA polymerase sigma factor (sigma-70 family)